MKRGVLIGLGALLIAGCGDMDGSGSPGKDDSIETRTGAIVDGWTGWFSDAPGSVQISGTCGWDSAAITAAACSGRYCDNMNLYCETLPAGFTPAPGELWWSPNYISDENPAGVSCPSGYILHAIAVTGSYADNLKINCAPMTYPPQGSNCKWMPFFSEEQGTQHFNYTVQSYAPAVADGVKCSGSYCDNLSFHVCEPRCTSHADCFSACNFTTGTCSP
jgi:hypothetical protein